MKDNQPSDGQATATNDVGREIRVRYADARHTLHLVFLLCYSQCAKAMNCLATAATAMQVGCVKTFGNLSHHECDSPNYPSVLAAIFGVVRTRRCCGEVGEWSTPATMDAELEWKFATVLVARP